MIERTCGRTYDRSHVSRLLTKKLGKVRPKKRREDLARENRARLEWREDANAKAREEHAEEERKARHRAARRKARGLGMRERGEGRRRHKRAATAQPARLADLGLPERVLRVAGYALGLGHYGDQFHGHAAAAGERLAAELAQLSDEDLLSTKGLGRAALNDIYAALASVGLHPARRLQSPR